MRTRFAWYTSLIGILVFYSFLLYTLSAVPFFGIHFDHYSLCIASCILVFSLVFGFVLLYYWLYDYMPILEHVWAKWSVGFTLSFSILYVEDFFIRGIAVHLVAKIILALLFMFLFSGDPLSKRDLARTIKKVNKKDSVEK